MFDSANGLSYGEDNDGWYIECSGVQIAFGLTEEVARSIVTSLQENARLKQQNTELAAMVAVKDAALKIADKYLCEAEHELGGGDDELNLEPAILGCRDALSITGPAAVHEIRAQVLEDAATWLEKNRSKWLGDLPEAALRKLAAAERAKGERSDGCNKISSAGVISGGVVYQGRWVKPTGYCDTMLSRYRLRFIVRPVF